MLIIFLIYSGLWSRTLNETVRALPCIFYQKTSLLLSQGAPSFCLPIFTACHFNAGESISLTALQANVLSLQRREGCAAAEEAHTDSAQLHAQLGSAPNGPAGAAPSPLAVTEPVGDQGNAVFCAAFSARNCTRAQFTSPIRLC